MFTNETIHNLEKVKELTNTVLNNINAINAAWRDGFKETVEQVTTLEARMESVRAVWMNPEFPPMEDVAELEVHLVGIHTALENIQKLYQDDDMPSPEELQDMAKAAQDLASSLEQASAARAS